MQVISRKPSTLIKDSLEKVYIDIYRLLNYTIFRGYRYISSFIDNAIYYIEIALLKSKDNVFNEFKKFITREEI